MFEEICQQVHRKHPFALFWYVGNSRNNKVQPTEKILIDDEWSIFNSHARAITQEKVTRGFLGEQFCYLT